MNVIAEHLRLRKRLRDHDCRAATATSYVRANSARQVVTAAGDGATAAIRADHYISDRFGGTPGIGEWEPNVKPMANDLPKLK